MCYTEANSDNDQKGSEVASMPHHHERVGSQGQ
jgi:hypothetical protein